MAVSGYQNPLEYQMYSAFEKKEEEDTPVTTTSLTETQPVSTTQQPVRSSLDILQSAGIQPTQKTAASDILKGAGFTSAKDVLRSMYFERPDGVLESQGISAASILEDYRKEQEAIKKQQDLFTGQQSAASIAAKAEADLRKKEAEYIKNYRYDLPQQGAGVYKTAFGDLSFDPSKVSLRPNRMGGTFVSSDNVVDSFGYVIRNVSTTKDNQKIEGDRYVFLPADFVMRGMEGQEAKVLNTGFLKQETWDALFKAAQPIDLSEVGTIRGSSASNLKDTALTQGFLFNEKDYATFYNAHLKDKFVSTYNYEPAYANTKVLGIANYNGELVYIRENLQQGNTTYYNTYVNSEGLVNSTYYTAPKDRGGVAGVFQDVGKFVASVPFGPEIGYIASGGNPYVYASLKALQVSGSGGSPSDVLKAAAVTFVTSTVAQDLGSYGESLGNSIHLATGIPVAVANTMGAAVVNAGFNGFVAAATGQDIGDAMLTGAIAGGVGANADTLTNTIFGGAENVKAVSDTLNLSVRQTQRIFTGALSSGAINSVVKGGDFIDAFKESLIVQGVSQSGANLVGQKLTGSLSPKAIKAIQDNTRIFLQATARAAVRGEDMETAIARVAPYLQGRAIGQTINIATSKKD